MEFEDRFLYQLTVPFPFPVELHVLSGCKLNSSDCGVWKLLVHVRMEVHANPGNEVLKVELRAGG